MFAVFDRILRSRALCSRNIPEPDVSLQEIAATKNFKNQAHGSKRLFSIQGDAARDIKKSDEEGLAFTQPPWHVELCDHVGVHRE